MITLENITKSYRLGDQEVTVLKGINLEIKKGEFVAIMGQSGSGKSTLMNIIGLLDVATSGSYILGERLVSALPENAQVEVRSRMIGFVFQSYNLLPRLSAVKQVGVPLSYQGVRRHEREERAENALRSVGLGDRLFNRSNELSGGQQQRVAIARAIVTNPEVILADEPTGALDSHTGEEVLTIFKNLNREGRTVVMVTHEPDVAQHAQRIIHIKDGLIVD